MACSPFARGQSVSLYSENFESLVLGPIVSFETEERNPAAWTQTGPAGWVADDSGVPTVGNPLAGAKEFEGWSFVDREWWISTAGDQNRAQFLGGSGIVAVADPDEWDDFPASGTPDPESLGLYDAKLRTPFINLAGAPAGQTISLSFNSSWRFEGAQKASVTAKFNDSSATSYELLRWDSRATIDNVANPAFKPDATNEVVVIPFSDATATGGPNFAVPTGATAVQLEFRLFDAVNNWWWAFDNLNVFTGDAPPQPGVLKAVVNRDSGEVTLVNDATGPLQLRGYSLVSADGVFNESAADFLAPADNWLRATRFNDTTNDLSEVNLNFDTIAPGEEIRLGQVRQDYYLEGSDLRFEYLVEGNDDPASGVVEFIGNGDQGFDFLDLNYDGAIDLLDWQTFRAAYGKRLTGLSVAQRYNLGDLDADGRHTVLDFQVFRGTYEGLNGSGSFARLLAIPEPTAVTLIGLAGLAFAARRRVAAAAGPFLLACVVAGGLAGDASAQLKLLDEGFEGLPLADPIEEATEGDAVVTRTPPAGWTITNDIPGLGNPATDGVVDFAGWSFANRAWWVSTAGQDRQQFTRASGTILVADSDEWDDATNQVNPAAGLFYNTFIRTPVVPIPAGIPAGRIQLSFDSSWRPEDDDGPANQIGELRVFYDGASQGNRVLRWESDVESADFKPDSTNERVVLDLQYDGVSSSLSLEFAQIMSDNDWWWAIDNVLVSVPSNPLKLQVNTTTGQAFLRGDDVIATDVNFLSIESDNGVLTGTRTRGLSGAGLSAVDGFDAGSVAGDSAGEQWETLVDPETAAFQFAEAFLSGQSTFDDADVIYLGQLMDPATPAANRDIRFSYALPTGDIVEVAAEDVEYFAGPAALPGDYNLDGRVDAADYTTWRDDTASFPANALTVWRQNYGRSAPIVPPAATSAVAVPEPGAIALLAALVGAAAIRAPRRAAAVAVIGLAAIGSDAAAKTNDRLYSFGEDAFERTNAAGRTLANQLVGAFNPSGNQTEDSAGIAGAGRQLVPLVARGLSNLSRPRYVAVTDRPDGVGGFGIALNQAAPGAATNIQYLATGFGEALNYPEFSTSSVFATPAGSIDYDLITDRGFQLWTKPTRVAESHIVMDTNQHGVLIDANGNFAMRYAYNQEEIDARALALGVNASELDDLFDYSSDVSVVANRWYHLSVVRPFGPGNGSVLFVDGRAVAAATGSYLTEDIRNDPVTGNPDPADLAELDTSPLVVGANTGRLLDPANASVHRFFYSGIVDDLEMFVMGLNGGTGGPTSNGNFGEYVFERDNGFAAAFPRTPGDLNGDGLVTLTDAQAFADNWLFTKRLTWTDFRGNENSLVVGDLDSRDRGDFNYDGAVNLRDWAILNNANPSIAAFALAAINGAVIPEPTSVVVAAAACVLCGAMRRRS